MRKNFDARNLLKHRRVLSRSVSVVWNKYLDRKSWYALLMHKMFRYQKFTETQKVSFKNCFGSVRQKTSTENRDITFLCKKKFRYQKFSETQKVSSMKCFSAVWQRTSSENRDIPFLCIKCFDTRHFLKHGRVLLEHFSVLWDKKRRQKIVISPS